MAHKYIPYSSVFCLMRHLSFLALLLLLLFTSCNTKCISKESFLKNFNAFSEDMEEHYRSLQAEDWTEIEKEYTSYLTNCYPKFKEEMTATERLSFWKNAFAYGFRRSEQDVNYEFDIENYGINIDEEVESLSIAGQEELERFLKEEFGPELENVFDTLIKELEGLGDELKNWLDNL